MATTTPNLGLVLPVGSENVSRLIINGNNSAIDTAYGQMDTKITNTDGKIGDLSELETTEKSNIVGAINEEADAINALNTAIANVTTWTLLSTVTISANGDASSSITIPASAREWAIQIEGYSMLLVSINVTNLAAGWISIGKYSDADVTANHSGQNLSIAFRKDGSTIFGGKNMYVYYR